MSFWRALTRLGIATRTVDHAPVFTVEEARALRGEIPGGHCKNLFLKDDKGAIYLIVCLEDAKVDLKAAPARIGSRRLTFGKPDLLMEILGVEPGSVTPFGLINDTAGRATVILDKTHDGAGMAELSSLAQRCDDHHPRRGPAGLHPRHRPRAANHGRQRAHVVNRPAIGHLSGEDGATRR